MNFCVWCGGEHATPLQLCQECENRARALRAGLGLNIREIPATPVREEPDD